MGLLGFGRGRAPRPGGAGLGRPVGGRTVRTRRRAGVGPGREAQHTDVGPARQAGHTGAARHEGTARRGAAGLLALALLTLPVLAACGTGSDSAASAAPADDDRPVVLTTFTVLADIAENVSGGHLRVESITKPGAEIHEYEPTPDDVKKAAAADLVLENGMNLETWISQFVQNADAEHVTVSEGVEPIDIAAGSYEGKPNPHAWMSPAAGEVYVDNIAAAFSDLDPEHADDYASHAEDYKERLRDVGEELESSLSGLPERQRVLLTCEGAFSYLARDAGLTERYLWPVNSDEQGTAQQMTAAIDYVEEHDVPAVFCESTVSDQSMQQVVTSTNAAYGGTLYVDSLSEADGPVPTYLDLLRHDAETISAALTGRDA
ncbi:metal ABC transporter substrate-binding protein [Rothia sp. AR01]|uniref:Metal ABC transporter substrate-binding protein n=1 Tax=Rothia santali TaxID=2949643 RepID=A0A9X2KIH7_9MICC|nr:metal ABC transporter substrate-binding protein [Rothia santali]MCP3426907.1 metal ABC transporter substrate-binding protein [Rothia santali]